MKTSFNRLQFVPLESKHYNLLFTLWHQPELIQYTYHPYIETIEEAQLRVNKILNHYQSAEPLAGPYLVFNDQNFIGYCGMDQVESTVKSFEIWYLISPAYHGQGYGTETAKMLLQIAFEKLNALSVTADVVKQNLASIRILEKNGFKQIEELPLMFNRNGITTDLLKYSLSKEDWLIEH